MTKFSFSTVDASPSKDVCNIKVRRTSRSFGEKEPFCLSFEDRFRFKIRRDEQLDLKFYVNDRFRSRWNVCCEFRFLDEQNRRKEMFQLETIFGSKPCRRFVVFPFPSIVTHSFPSDVKNPPSRHRHRRETFRRIPNEILPQRKKRRKSFRKKRKSPSNQRNLLEGKRDVREGFSTKTNLKKLLFSERRFSSGCARIAAGRGNAVAVRAGSPDAERRESPKCNEETDLR